MGWRGILYVLFFLLTVVESSSRSFKIWLPTVGAESDSVVAYSWPVFTASLFVLVALILSTYLIIEHLAAYNQPEVHAHNPFVVVQVFVSYCIFLVLSYFFYWKNETASSPSISPAEVPSELIITIWMFDFRNRSSWLDSFWWFPFMHLNRYKKMKQRHHI